MIFFRYYLIHGDGGINNLKPAISEVKKRTTITAVDKKQQKLLKVLEQSKSADLFYKLSEYNGTIYYTWNLFIGIL